MPTATQTTATPQAWLDDPVYVARLLLRLTQRATREREAAIPCDLVGIACSMLRRLSLPETDLESWDAQDQRINETIWRLDSAAEVQS
jgi:hypothetical protein